MPLTIRSATGAHRFTVDIARTAQEQETGLMFVKSLPANRGMIFPYEPPQEVAFWMKNTLIPLDMVFIRADGTIARITTARPDARAFGRARRGRARDSRRSRG